jgi:predicted Rdx family selenoprotein
VSLASACGLTRAGTAFDIRDRPRRGALAPGIGDVFEITYDGETIWGRKADGGFPDVKTLKRPVRDRLDPSRDLGHIARDRADEEGK